MTRVAIRPEMIRWARERAGHDDIDSLLGRFPGLADWESGEKRPTMKQVEAFAKAVHVPVGYLFLSEAPDERLPIPDFRTVEGRPLHRPSPDLLDTLYTAQDRQDWFHDFAQVTRLPEPAFVGIARLDDPPPDVARRMAGMIGFDLDARASCHTWEEALRLFIAGADAAGVLVMVSGIVGSNTHRVLDPQEFRGFALSDRRAPLVFINGADSKSGQMFTLAHELAHLWLGASAISNASAAPLSGHRREEVWCNAVAAELLVPLAALREVLDPGEPLARALPRLTRHFKVSALVMLRRQLDAGALSRPAFDAAWAAERERLRALAEKGANGGGNFYRTTLSRVSRRFARALIESTLEGQTLYRDAFRMLGVRNTATFNEIGRQAGVMI